MTKPVDKKELGEELLSAASKGYTGKVRELLEAGVDVNARYNDGITGLNGITVLIVAASWGKTEVIRVLLKARAEVNARDNGGGSALIAAAFGGHPEAIRELLKAGAKKWAMTDGGETAFDMWTRKHKNHPDFQEISDLLRPKKGDG